MNELLLNKELFPLSWKTRNLVRFSRHQEYEIHKECFACTYAFRDKCSRFSILKNYNTLPGPRTPALELKGWYNFAHTKNDCRHTVMNSA